MSDQIPGSMQQTAQLSEFCPETNNHGITAEKKLGHIKAWNLFVMSYYEVSQALNKLKPHNMVLLKKVLLQNVSY